MTRKSPVLALLAFFFLSLPLQAQVTLAWKFEEGETLYIENIETQKMSLEYMDKDNKVTKNKQETVTTTISSLKVQKNTALGTILDLTIESLKTKVNGKEAAKDAKRAEKIKGSVFTITLNPAGKITKLLGYEDYIKKLADGDEAEEKVARAAFPEEALKKSLEDSFNFLPGRPVKKGETWKQDAVVPMGLFGSFKVVKTFTYQGQEEGGDTIGFASAMTYMPPSGEGAVVKVIKGSLKAEEGKGSFLFNTAKGRLIKGGNRLIIKGAMTVEIMGMQQNMELSVDLATSIRILDKNPLRK
jgi:uncharacterized protein DUF6263